MNKQESATSFDNLGITPAFVETLHKLHFKVPTPIQHSAIPLLIEGKDLVGIAQTGTGKTLAFGIPLVQKLVQHRGLGLIVVPTRELASQVDETIQKIGRPNGIRTAVLIGGASMYNQVSALRRHPQVIVATPGRLLDHIQQRTVLLFDVVTLILDEADRMFDMGFAPQLEKILKELPKQRQTMLFSATMPAHIMRLAAVHMNKPVTIEIAPQGTAADKVTQELFIVAKDAKKELLKKLLKQYTGPILVFTRTKIHAHMLTRQLYTDGQYVAEIHSDRSLAQRREALAGFKSGKYRVLIATDIAARGIDVTGIELVINYDLPDETESYVHRIGRTGRAGQPGHAISIATPDQGSEVKKIERLMRKELPRGKHPEVFAQTFDAYAPSSRGPRSYGGYKGRSGSGGGGYKKFNKSGSGSSPKKWGYKRADA